MTSWLDSCAGSSILVATKKTTLRRTARATAASSTARVVGTCHSTWSGEASLRGRPGRRWLSAAAHQETSALHPLRARSDLLADLAYRLSAAMLGALARFSSQPHNALL